MLRSIIIVVVVLAALPLPAQRALETPAPPPLLRVMSRDVELLQAVAALFDAEPAALTLQPGEQYGEVVVQANLKVEQRSTSGAMREECSSEVLLRPAGLLEVFADRAAALRQRLAAPLGVLLQQVGFPRRLGAELLDDALALLPQIDAVYVQVEGEPRQAGKGLTVRIDMVPVPATDLLHYFEKLSPNRSGVPQPPGDAGVCAAQLSLDPAFHYALLQPFLAIAAQLGATTEAQQKQSGDWLDRMLQAWDGGFACRFDGRQLLTLLGLRDADAFTQVLSDPQYLAHQQQSARQRHLDLEFTPKALRYRDCELLQTVSSTPTDNPLLPLGEITSFTGVAGGMAMTIGGADVDAQDARRTVDQVLDGKVARQPLRDTDRGRQVPALATLSLALDRLPGFEAAMSTLPADSRPERIHLLIYKVGVTLKLRLDLR